MENTGQSCNAPTRMIVPKNRQHEVWKLQKMLQKIDNW